MSGPIVVVGDAMLDVDLVGTAQRLCPDAPVPVVDGVSERPRAGGAALAAALAARDGHEVVLLTALAEDEPGERLARLVADTAVRVVAVPHAGTTPVKRRIRAGGQSVARLDSGAVRNVGPLPGGLAEMLSEAAVVLVSDYGQGTGDVPELRELVHEVARRTPLVWDPHPRGRGPVPGARVVTPNRQEATALLPEPVPPTLGALATVSAQAQALVRHWQAHAVAVTLGAGGALLCHGESSPSVFPAPQVPAGDTCGAGDRFASRVATALAEGALPPEAVQAAVAAASGFVAAGGAAGSAAAEAPGARAEDPVAEVQAAGGTLVATGGCFDLLHAGHVATLEAARALGDCLVVCLNSDASVRRLKGPTRPLVPETDRRRVLEALEVVDAVVVFDEDTPEAVLRRLRPDVWAKGGDYAGAELPEAPVLREWGGQSVVLPYLAGRSTTRLVETARS